MLTVITSGKVEQTKALVYFDSGSVTVGAYRYSYRWTEARGTTIISTLLAGKEFVPRG